MHQGWPKFTSHLWMATPDGGLAAIAYAPCEVKAVVADGSPITLEVETEYPFDDTIRIRVKTSQPVKFPLWLRIPGWADKAQLSVSETLIEQNARNGFQILDRVWTDGDVIELQLPMSIRVTQDVQGGVSLERGPLVYSLKIDEEWRYLKGEKPHADYEVYPTTPWNYGLALDSKSPEQSIEVIKKPVGSCPFSPDGAPIELHLLGRHLPDWQMVQNSAGPLPESPVQSEEPDQELILIPYGSTNLRITVFPKIVNN
jgi:hypothetical protein